MYWKRYFGRLVWYIPPTVKRLNGNERWNNLIRKLHGPSLEEHTTS